MPISVTVDGNIVYVLNGGAPENITGSGSGIISSSQSQTRRDRSAVVGSDPRRSSSPRTDA